MREWGPARLLVGLPYNMDGSDTVLTASVPRLRRRTRAALRPAGGVRRRTPDLQRRDTTSCARRAARAHARGGSGAEDIDANAARLILETWLRAYAERPGASLEDRHRPRPAARLARTPASPAHARRTLARRTRAAARPRAVLRARTRRPAAARRRLARPHGRQPVLRAEHAHARLVRAGRDRASAPTSSTSTCTRPRASRARRCSTRSTRCRRCWSTCS